jgi:hypothetical protein
LKAFLSSAFFAAIFVINIFSQYTSPESVTFDSVGNRYLVTNSGGVIKQRSSNGTVTDFAPSGSGTHGIRIYNGTAYVCASNRIKGFSLSNGVEVFNVQLTGASFLNGMGIDNAGIAYISDFTAQKIYKLNLNTQAWWIYVTSPGGQPNGVYVDSPRNRLLVCFWGSNAAVKSVNLADSTITLLTNTGYNNCDGIYADKFDNVYVSSWSPTPSKILKYDINFANPVVVVLNSGLSNPADIFIAKSRDTLAVPNSGNNTVTFYNINSLLSIQQVNSTMPEDFKLHQNFPNPFNPVTKITFDIPSGDLKTTKLTIYDSSGKEIIELFKTELAPGSYAVSFDASNYSSDVYFYTLQYGERTSTGKMILVK